MIRNIIIKISRAVGFILIFIGSIIIFGNQIPLPELLSTWIENLGIPINGGELFGRKYER